MQNLKNAITVLMESKRPLEGLLAQVVARMIGSESPGAIHLRLAQDIPETDKIHDLIMLDIVQSQANWRDIAEAVLLMTAYDPEEAVGWLKIVSQITMPASDCFDEAEKEEILQSHSRVFGCFLGILRSIDWLDEKALSGEIDGEAIKEIFAPFLLDEPSFNIDLSNYGFRSESQAKAYRQALSVAVDNVGYAQKFERWQILIRELANFGEMTFESFYFHSYFLNEICYKTFGSVKSAAERANILLASADYIKQAAM